MLYHFLLHKMHERGCFKLPEKFFNGQYSFQACRKNCIHSNLLQNCGCIDEISTVRNVSLCKILDEDDVKCVENVRNSVRTFACKPYSLKSNKILSTTII